MEPDDPIRVEFDQYRLAIGGLVMAFGRLESKLDDTLALLINADDSKRALLVVSRITSFVTKVKILSDLCHRHFARRRSTRNDLAEYVRLLCNRLERASETRNRLVHATWAIRLGFSRNGMHGFKQQRQRKKIGQSARQLGIRHIDRISGRFDVLTHRVDQLQLAVRGIPFSQEAILKLAKELK